ncbi:MAG: DUF3990 domain-containing protein [Bacteroidales bacterium]|nr:DUF3990 domain-containing protein [Bacteroidales bacterium]
MITLYHGSNERISNIDLTKCNPYKDFGQAFYLTTDPRQAMDVAIARVDIFGGEPIVNTYCFNEQLLKDGTLSFKSFSEYNEKWADFVYQHRDETNVPPYMHSFDVVYGPIANDRVGLQIRNYRLGNIDKKEFLRRLKYMKGITFQYAFCTPRAIEKLQPYESK